MPWKQIPNWEFFGAESCALSLMEDVNCHRALGFWMGLGWLRVEFCFFSCSQYLEVFRRLQPDSNC